MGAFLCGTPKGTKKKVTLIVQNEDKKGRNDESKIGSFVIDESGVPQIEGLEGLEGITLRVT